MLYTKWSGRVITLLYCRHALVYVKQTLPISTTKKWEKEGMQYISWKWACCTCAPRFTRWFNKISEILPFFSCMSVYLRKKFLVIWSSNSTHVRASSNWSFKQSPLWLYNAMVHIMCYKGITTSLHCILHCKSMIKIEWYILNFK